MRRSYRYDPVLKEMVEITRERPEGGLYVQNDITDFVSPLDGTIITSRNQLRNHMKRHNVAFAEDCKEHTKRKQAERIARANGTHPEVRAQRIQDARNAFERVRDSRIANGTWRS